MPNITAARLEQLEKKERAHDDYMAATKDVRAKLVALELEYGPHRAARNTDVINDPLRHPAFLSGYRCCLRDFAQAIVEASASRE